MLSVLLLQQKQRLQSCASSALPLPSWPQPHLSQNTLLQSWKVSQQREDTHELSHPKARDSSEFICQAASIYQCSLNNKSSPDSFFLGFHTGLEQESPKIFIAMAIDSSACFSSLMLIQYQFAVSIAIIVSLVYSLDCISPPLDEAHGRWLQWFTLALCTSTVVLWNLNQTWSTPLLISEVQRSNQPMVTGPNLAKNHCWEQLSFLWVIPLM